MVKASKNKKYGWIFWVVLIIAVYVWAFLEWTCLESNHQQLKLQNQSLMEFAIRIGIMSITAAAKT